MRIAIVLITLLMPALAAADHHFDAIEGACQDAVQGRIAWNDEGDRRWDADNLVVLCQGTRRAEEPGRCFQEAMHGGVDWGGGTRWEWENALALCRGTSDARETLGCFRNGIARGLQWDAAIDRCAGVVFADTGRQPRSAHRDFRDSNRRGGRAGSCQEWVQGRIPWNYDGDRLWADPYLDRLCHGTAYPAEPGRCYDRVMHGGINWGGGTRWEPDNALALCAGSNDADATIRCFQDALAYGESWERALSRCGRY